MTAFRRTVAGLNNQHLFYNVDFVVFLEGGAPYAKDEVYSGNFTEETNDTIFWRNLFEKFSPKNKYKFKSVGGKCTVMAIAKDIIDNDLNNVLVALDSEFDQILKKKIIHENVLYTHGYSWENDIWNAQIITSVIEELSFSKTEYAQIKLNFESFLSKIKLGVYADGYLFKKEKEGFFPRPSGSFFCINLTSTSLPEVKSAEINMRISRKGLKNSTLYAFGRRHSLDVLQFCFGHFLSDYCCQVIKRYLNINHSLKNIQNHFIHRIGLCKFFNALTKGCDIYKYYESQFRRAKLYNI